MGCKEPEQRVVLVPQQKLLAGECARQLMPRTCEIEEKCFCSTVQMLTNELVTSCGALRTQTYTLSG